MFLLTLTSQYATGMAVLKNDGFPEPVNASLITGGTISAAFAGFLGSGVNSAAIIAAIGTGEHAEMAKLRHIAITVADLKSSADFYEKAFGMSRLRENAVAVSLSDGVVNITLLKFPTDEMAGDERGKDFTGLHHIGFEGFEN